MAIPRVSREHYVGVIGDRLYKLRNGCTLRAVCSATGVDPQEVLRAFVDAGWIEGRGATPGLYHYVIKKLGFEVEEAPNRAGSFRSHPHRFTLSQFLRRNPSGTFVVSKNDHAFTIVNGIVHDLRRPEPRCRICTAVRVRPITQTPTRRPLSVPAESLTERLSIP